MTRTFLATLASVAFSTAALADASDWFVSGGATYIDSDTSRADDDDVTGYLGLGYWLGEKFSLEGEYSEYSFDLVDNLGEVDISGFNVNGKYYFKGGYETSPYLGLGFGLMDSEGPFGGDEDAIVDAIAGVQWVLGKRLGLRSELRYRFDSDDDTLPQSDRYEDWLLNIGLTYAFGDRVKPQPPAPAPVVPEPCPDEDDDGVCDDRDRCPGTPYGRPVDRFGCEPEPPPQPEEILVTLEGVNFEFDKATLRPEAIATLNDGLAKLRRYGEIRVAIEGHTDSVGNDEYNLKLSERRAKAVYDWFLDQGISPARMRWEGFGENRPIATNDTREGRAQNRRVELRVIE